MAAEFDFCNPDEPPPGSGNVAKHNALFQCVLIRCARNAGKANAARRHPRRRWSRSSRLGDLERAPSH
jgi:hypothetical protein